MLPPALVSPVDGRSLIAVRETPRGLGSLEVTPILQHADLLSQLPLQTGGMQLQRPDQVQRAIEFQLLMLEQPHAGNPQPPSFSGGPRAHADIHLAQRLLLPQQQWQHQVREELRIRAANLHQQRQPYPRDDDMDADLPYNDDQLHVSHFCAEPYAVQQGEEYDFVETRPMDRKRGPDSASLDAMDPVRHCRHSDNGVAAVHAPRLLAAPYTRAPVAEQGFESYAPVLIVRLGIRLEEPVSGDASGFATADGGAGIMTAVGRTVGRPPLGRARAVEEPMPPVVRLGRTSASGAAAAAAAACASPAAGGDLRCPGTDCRGGRVASIGTGLTAVVGRGFTAVVRKQPGGATDNSSASSMSGGPWGAVGLEGGGAAPPNRVHDIRPVVKASTGRRLASDTGEGDSDGNNPAATAAAANGTVAGPGAGAATAACRRAPANAAVAVPTGAHRSAAVAKSRGGGAAPAGSDGGAAAVAPAPCLATADSGPVVEPLRDDSNSSGSDGDGGDHEDGGAAAAGSAKRPRVAAAARRGPAAAGSASAPADQASPGPIIEDVEDGLQMLAARFRTRPGRTPKMFAKLGPIAEMAKQAASGRLKLGKSEMQQLVSTVETNLAKALTEQKEDSRARNRLAQQGHRSRQRERIIVLEGQVAAQAEVISQLQKTVRAYEAQLREQ